MRQKHVGHVIVLVGHDGTQEAYPGVVVAVVVDVHFDLAVVVVVVVVSLVETAGYFSGHVLVGHLSSLKLFPVFPRLV